MNRWEGWAITVHGKLVLFDAGHPIYWKRSIARKEAEERGLLRMKGANIIKVDVLGANERRKERS